MAYSAGFHPHPKISYVGAAPTGVGSEAEYLEIALADRRNPDDIRQALDTVLPDGLDIVACLDISECRPGGLADQIQASLWRIELSDDVEQVELAVATLLAEDSVPVERLTKDGRRTLDARAPIVSASVRSGAVSTGGESLGGVPRAILEVVVRQVTPTVRPDDVITALKSVAGFAPSQPPRATRLAQGPIDEAGTVHDPLRSTERL
jgi:radical SAM-linked protein